MLDDAFDGYLYGADDFLSVLSDSWAMDQCSSLWEQGASVSPTDVDPGIWHQQTTPFTCAVVCQEMILREFGIEVSEAQLVYDATANGWLTNQGTSLEDVGRLLEYYGVPVHRGYGNGIESLATELAMGHKVIVAVDSGELWKQDWFFEDLVDPNGADHAVVVSGLDVSDPTNPQVYLNDPGDPKGAGKAYPLDEFLNAWRDSGCYYVATDHAPMNLAEHSLFGTHFNPHTGMYMDADFWSSWLQEAVSGFDVELFKSLLSQFGPAKTAGAASRVLDIPPTLTELDDAARNKLFLTVI